MGIGLKIRVLLLIMGVCCILTAVSLKHAVSKKDLLEYEGDNLQKNLSKSEQLIYTLLSDRAETDKLKRLHIDESLALQFINHYRPEEISLVTYENNESRFWSSYLVSLPPLNLIKEGANFMQLQNGWYEVIKKTDRNYSFVFVIAVKNQFPIENKYLRNEMSSKLLPSQALSLASFTDKEVYGIKSITGKLLFEVKLKPDYSSSVFATMEVWLWVIGLFCFSLYVNSYCAHLAKRGYLFGGTALLFAFFLIVRLTDLQYGWFNNQFNLEIFSPTIYGDSFFLPSLGDFLLNVFSTTWILLFIYTHKEKYRLPGWLRRGKLAAWLINGIMLLVLACLAFLIDRIFSGLVYNSKINFDITNIINLGWASWISIIILCLVWFNVYLITCIFMCFSTKVKSSNKDRLTLFLVAFALYFLYRANVEFTVFFIAYGVFLLALAWNIFIQRARFSVGIYAVIFFCLALISSIKYVKYQDIKERSKRFVLAQRLQSSDNPRVIRSIEGLEQGIESDQFVLSFFRNPTDSRAIVLEKLIDKSYLDSYLAQYSYTLLPFDAANRPLRTGEKVPLGHYKELVQSGSVKVSNYFYRLNNTFGYQSYFGIVPIFNSKRIVGTIVIELRSEQYNYDSRFPELLVDGKVKSEEDYKDYSFAFYNYGKLINQAGSYTYKLKDDDFKGPLEEAIYKSDPGTNYTHMVYRPSTHKTIVISKEKVNYVTRLAILSFFFLVFILFALALYILVWIVKNVDENWGGWFNINRSLMINANKILYKTRIQFSIVLSVVATLLIVGWTTFFYISSEYRKQQDDLIREKLRKVQLLYNKKVQSTGIPPVNDLSNQDFEQFSDLNSTYLDLFDLKGNLMFTSSPKIYDYGVLAKKMEPKAFIRLSHFQRSEYISPYQTISEFAYSAAYAAIRNAKNETIAYISLPYYNNEDDYQNKIGLFINTLINIYALVFVAIGVLAVFLANQITNPLTFIQESIRKTKLGQKNQPIEWSRHDEIGSLIREYNKMIAALEESAAKLAKSERESAWREMAKQVAHEIKNPLTPLKLGVQLLEKSWKEQDPNFEKKFERFNKSFVEQIDSLASIASEFSNFAKMPDTKLLRLQLLPIVKQASTVFSNADEVEIYVVDETDEEVYIMGDKDQLLRTFNNLLKNAIEAVSGVKECMIYIKLRQDKRRVWIELTDNGKGIDHELQDKIFAPNFTTKSSGTGLGLAFVKQAIENAGGTVDFKSVPDQGTTFYISFPLA